MLPETSGHRRSHLQEGYRVPDGFFEGFVAVLVHGGFVLFTMREVAGAADAETRPVSCLVCTNKSVHLHLHLFQNLIE